jgi:hypothetical protein
MNLDDQTKAIIRAIEAMGFRVEIERVKGRTKMAAIAPDEDEEWGIAATPLEAAKQLLNSIETASQK